MGAVQISLLEDPYIDFSISLFGSLDLMLLPGLKDAVNLVAKKVRAGAACKRVACYHLTEACRHTVAASAVKKCSLLSLLPEISGRNKCNDLSP